MFEIDGFWKDDKTCFEGYLVSEYDSTADNDDEIFFYGLSENEIQEAIKDPENSVLEFTITHYKKI